MIIWYHTWKICRFSASIMNFTIFTWWTYVWIFWILYYCWAWVYNTCVIIRIIRWWYYGIKNCTIYISTVFCYIFSNTNIIVINVKFIVGHVFKHKKMERIRITIHHRCYISVTSIRIKKWWTIIINRWVKFVTCHIWYVIWSFFIYYFIYISVM